MIFSILSENKYWIELKNLRYKQLEDIEVQESNKYFTNFIMTTFIAYKIHWEQYKI